MKPWKVGYVVLCMFLMALGAGCAGNQGVASPPTTTYAPTPTTESTTLTMVPTTIHPMEPQPTVTGPSGWTTILTVSRNPSSYEPDIIVVYNGGTGQRVLQQLEIVVTHPDGTVQTETISRPETGSIPVQTTEVIPQSVNDPVRVLVTAMYNGFGYPVYDEVMQPV